MKKILLTLFLLLLSQTLTAQSAKVIEVVMQEDSSITASIDLGGRYFSGIRLPAGWTGTEITIQDSWDNIDFKDVYWSDGSEVSFVVAEGIGVKMFPWDVLSLAPYIKIRSGNSATPVAQTSDMDLIIETNAFK